MSRPPTMAEIAARAKRDRDAEREDRRDWYAGLYGLYLRQQGYSPSYAAKLVVLRYPRTQGRLQRVIDEAV